jgi:hypothetical protein
VIVQSAVIRFAGCLLVHSDKGKSLYTVHLQVLLSINNQLYILVIHIISINETMDVAGHGVAFLHNKSFNFVPVMLMNFHVLGVLCLIYS